MPKRTVCIQNPSRLSVTNCALVINREDGKASIPLEDIWVVIVESQSVEVTSFAMSSLAEAGIGVMFCGRDHMPNGLLLPIGAHSRHAAIVEDQLAISKPLQKRLWQRIVVQKIRNQAKVLDLLGIDGSPVEKYVSEVRSGDTTNRESSAAAAFFRTLIPDGTRRNGAFTAQLDYGYGILRAGIGRSAVAGGWLVSRGIHHSSDLNAFNLVDDFIEPFRPLVDLIVFDKRLTGDLSHAMKVELARIFEYQVMMNNRKLASQTAIDEMFGSLRAAVIQGDESKLVLPSIVPLETGIFE